MVFKGHFFKENEGEIKKWNDRKNLVFSHMYLVERIEKPRDEKLLNLVEEKSERIKNITYINLLVTLNKKNIIYYQLKLIKLHLIKINTLHIL